MYSRRDYTRGEIENRLGKAEIGGYLAKLEKYYSLISKKRPIFSKENSKQVRYCIADNFLTFWFRFIYRYQGYIESGALKLVENIIRRDYDVFSGSMLERISVINLCNLVYILILVCTGIEKEKMKSILLH